MDKKSPLSAFLTAILIVGLVLASAMRFGRVQAASGIPKPSVPEFTLELVGPPFHVNTTYSLDPNTGQIVAILAIPIHTVH